MYGDGFLFVLICLFWVRFFVGKVFVVFVVMVLVFGFGAVVSSAGAVTTALVISFIMFDFGDVIV